MSKFEEIQNQIKNLPKLDPIQTTLPQLLKEIIENQHLFMENAMDLNASKSSKSRLEDAWLGSIQDSIDELKDFVKNSLNNPATKEIDFDPIQRYICSFSL